jgi:membrane protease YdiL (CAAX protease family)
MCPSAPVTGSTSQLKATMEPLLNLATRVASSPPANAAAHASGHAWWFFVPAVALFTLLAALYFGLAVARVRLRLARLLSSAIGPLVPPAVMLVAVALYCQVSGLSLPSPFFVGRGAETRSVDGLAIYAAYLFLPVLVALPRARAPFPALLAAAALWLPLQFRLLPPVLLPATADGSDVSRLLGLVNGLCLFLVTRPIAGVGFTFTLSAGDARRACRAFAIFAAVALPLGFATRFLAWHPDVTAVTLLALPLGIYLSTAIPEEFLFRGVVQNACTRVVEPRAALAISSVVFGLAHLPDWRYALLATFAGVAYGWVYSKTRKITASAITHTAVDWVWVLLLRT